MKNNLIKIENEIKQYGRDIPNDPIRSQLKYIQKSIGFGFVFFIYKDNNQIGKVCICLK